MAKKTQIVTVHELQAKASKIVKDVQSGSIYKVLRYSQPVAVVMSIDEYECLVGECKGCIKDFMQSFEIKPKKKK